MRMVNEGCFAIISQQLVASRAETSRKLTRGIQTTFPKSLSGSYQQFLFSNTLPSPEPESRPEPEPIMQQLDWCGAKFGRIWNFRELTKH